MLKTTQMVVVGTKYSHCHAVAIQSIAILFFLQIQGVLYEFLHHVNVEWNQLLKYGHIKQYGLNINFYIKDEGTIHTKISWS